MTPLSLAYAGARTQIPDAPLPVADHGARLAGASSRFLCLSFFAAAKKVSAAPHRGNTNRPLANQGKAKAPGALTKSAAKAKTKTKPLPLRRPKWHPRPHIHIPIIKFRRCHNMLLYKEC